MKYALLLLAACLVVATACPGLQQAHEKKHPLSRLLQAKKKTDARPGGARADPDLNYLQSGVVYQVYPRSFQDSNGDGVGDLKGITSRLDHFVELGVNVVWLSPIFKSPMADFGYDIADFIDIDPIFGNMNDFTDLMAAAKAKGLKIVLDMVPNHSSDEHDWFKKSVQRIDPYTDYYVWRDGKGPGVPPTNWISVFGGSMWNYSETRGQWYLHQFVAKQPDLNYRNPLVHEELKNILRFWLDKGVDGFRVDAVPHMYEDPTFPDETPSGNPDAKPNEYGYWNHQDTTWNRDETYGVIAEMREVLQEYENKDGVHRIMMTEAYVPLASVIKYYGNSTFRMADFPFNFALINGVKNCVQPPCLKEDSPSPLGSPFNGTQLRDSIVEFLNAVPSWAGPQSANWVLGNHDQRRIVTRYTAKLSDAMIMMQYLLPGTPVTYYGEEIGMEDTYISYEDTQDPQGCQAGPDRFDLFSRDPCRTPMQWDSSDNAGFSTSSNTWLPIGNNSKTVNVELEKETLVSHLNIFRTMVALRKQPAIKFGEVGFPVVDLDAFSLTRIRAGDTSYALLMNVGLTDRTFDLSSVSTIPATAQVVVRSVWSTNPNTQPGAQVSTKILPLASKEGIIISFTPV